MKDTIWKWIAIAAVGLLLVDIGWRSVQVWQWKKSVDTRLNDLEQAIDTRLTGLERAFLTAHPEFRQPPPPTSPQAPNQEQ